MSYQAPQRVSGRYGPMWTPGTYNPARQLGAVLGDAPAAASCPTRSKWWLVLAAAVGAFAGFKYTAPKKKPGRRG